MLQNQVMAVVVAIQYQALAKKVAPLAFRQKSHAQQQAHHHVIPRLG
jgi:hypothetical protein